MCCGRRPNANSREGCREGNTRVTESKHLTGQEHPRTSVVCAYRCDVGDPYNPVPRPENAVPYERYRADAEALQEVTFVRRLATYRSYNMDQVVAQALTAFKRLQQRRAVAPLLATAK